MTPSTKSNSLVGSGREEDREPRRDHGEDSSDAEEEQQL